MGTAVRRYDTATLDRAERDERGFLRVPAYLTRTGVFTYRRVDGTVVRELRHPDEVFAPDSLRTLGGAPVTDLHPSEPVGPSNVRDLEVGVVGDAVRRDGEFVAAELSIRDADAIRAVESGDRKELSCGYGCEIKSTPGVYQGQRYDQAQERIRYNHTAMGPEGWGRAGSQVALRLDGSNAALSLASDDAVMVAADNPKTPATAPDGDVMPTIRLDGVEFECPDQTAAAVNKELERSASALSDAQAERDKQRARADSLGSQLEETKRQLAEATDSAARADDIRKRVALEVQARDVLGEGTRLDSMSDGELRTACIQKLNPNARLDGQTDAYVDALYDFTLDAHKGRDVGLEDASETVAGAQRSEARSDSADRLAKARAARANASRPEVN